MQKPTYTIEEAKEIIAARSSHEYRNDYHVYPQHAEGGRYIDKVTYGTYATEVNEKWEKMMSEKALYSSQELNELKQWHEQWHKQNNPPVLQFVS